MIFTLFYIDIVVILNFAFIVYIFILISFIMIIIIIILILIIILIIIINIIVQIINVILVLTRICIKSTRPFMIFIFRNILRFKIAIYFIWILLLLLIIHCMILHIRFFIWLILFVKRTVVNIFIFNYFLQILK